MSADVARELRAESVLQASPRQVWQLLGDLSRMPRWSPETVRMVPLKRGGRRVGQWYLGINRRGAVWWPTRSVLTELEPERRIAWHTTSSGAHWIWELEPVEDGCRVVHRRPVSRVPRTARVFAATFLGGLPHHVDDLERDMQVTVDRLKQAVESPAGA